MQKRTLHTAVFLLFAVTVWPLTLHGQETSPEAVAAQTKKLDGAQVKPHRANQPQGMAKGLLDNGFLECLNRFGAIHTLLKTPGKREVEVWEVSQGTHRWFFAYAEQKLEATLEIIPVPVDRKETGRVHDSGRLSTLKSQLRALKSRYRLRAANRRETNPRSYIGKEGQWIVHAEYRADLDEIWVLRHK